MPPECKSLGAWSYLQNEGLYLHFFWKVSLYCTQAPYREFYWVCIFKPSFLGDVSNYIVYSTLVLPAVPQSILIALIYLVTVWFWQHPLACSVLLVLRLNSRQDCGASDPRLGCCRDQPAKDRQYLAGGPEALGVPQPLLETAAPVGSLRVGKRSRFVRSESQCLLNP